MGSSCVYILMISLRVKPELAVTQIYDHHTPSCAIQSRREGGREGGREEEGREGEGREGEGREGERENGTSAHLPNLDLSRTMHLDCNLSIADYDNSRDRRSII